MDARRRPARFPVRKVFVLRFDRVELAALQCRALRVLDRVLHRPLAIGITDPGGVCDHTVVPEHRGIHRIELRLVKIGAQHALL